MDAKYWNRVVVSPYKRTSTPMETVSIQLPEGYSLAH